EALSLRRQLSYNETSLETQLPEAATFVDAKVIGENGGPYDHALILSAGRKDGVEVGSAVVDNGGLLGHVVTAGNSAARVLLVTDYNSTVPVIIEDLQFQALLSGRSSGAPILEFFAEELEAPLVQGQRIVTSGAGGVLPRGIPVGEVNSARNGVVTISLYANHRSPDLVRVIDYSFPQDVDSTDPVLDQSENMPAAQGPSSASVEGLRLSGG
ncbi:MAG: rod shape-determining protein MreC, partial [Pseudomonadota bacterium]